MSIEITFLGTGTSQGVPVIACHCDVCESTDPKDKRLRSSVLIKSDKTDIVIDTGPDFRQQMLRSIQDKLDAVLFTHEHKDHVAGLDDVRAYNYVQKNEMQVYSTERVADALRREFHYVFAGDNYPGIPKIQLNTIDKEVFKINDLEIIPIEVMHYKMPVLGFRIKNFTYITDAKTISEKEKEKIKGSKVLVLNALRRHDHISHFTLQEALKIVEELKPEKAYFTHISHYLGKHKDVSQELPENVALAYDGLKIVIE